MMRRRSVIVLLSACLIAAAGCERYDIDEVLLQRDEMSLTWKGIEQLVYDPLTWQYSYNVARGEYRVNDDSMSDYYVLTSEDRLSFEGQEVDCDVEWTVKTNVKRFERLKFVVKKTDAAGKFWLWNRSQKIGVVVTSAL